MENNTKINFNFPFKPYDVQEAFMLSLYQTLNESKVGIFESPTGTGKSLSIICGSLTWLRDFKESEKIKLGGEMKKLEIVEDDEKNDWIEAHHKRILMKKQMDEYKSRLDILQLECDRIEQLKNQSTKKRKREEQQFREIMRSAKKFQDNDAQIQENEDEHVSDSEFLPQDINVVHDYDDYSDDEKEDTEEKNSLKIFYCSRTHSQLAQFVREVQKSPFGKDARVITLGSRQNLCINDSVRKLNNLSLINERCTEMQKNKSKQDDVDKVKKKIKKNNANCPFYKRYTMEELRDFSLVEVQDIEQIVDSGKELKACPYYSMRLGVTDAEIVVLPYNILLQESMRKACGINLKNNIVIVDEAHNLLETISNIHSLVLYGSQISSCYNQLTHYLERFRSRLNPFNLLCIKQILTILASFIKILAGSTKNTTTTKLPKEQQGTTIYNLIQFLTTSGIDHFNFFDILNYCEKSYIARKLNGFSAMQYPTASSTVNPDNRTALAKFLEQQKNQKDMPNIEPVGVANENQEFSSTASFTSIQEFLKCLTNANKDGRVIVDKQETLKTSSLKFLLLNPSIYFIDVIKDARSVILAGGTMSPVTDFTETLFKAADLTENDIKSFSCGHVIPKDHLLPLILETGPGNIRFDFTYKNRDNPKLIEELGRLTVNLCSITPGGIILFFPSYDYEQKIYTQWEKSGVIFRLNGKKRVFREPRNSSQTDKVLNEYSSIINKPNNGQNGAILLSIVGGKMSEGINFSDNLGRLVIMVGLPYPNIESPELKERMKYISASGRDSKQLPETLCMRAVNQSIGRAIRHSKDYAAILLLDERYRKNWVQSALPKWISGHLQSYDKFGSMFCVLRKFYQDKK